MGLFLVTADSNNAEAVGQFLAAHDSVRFSPISWLVINNDGAGLYEMLAGFLGDNGSLSVIEAKSTPVQYWCRGEAVAAYAWLMSKAKL